MGDDHLNTIPAMKSDEFIKSSVENLVPTPNISEKKILNPLFDEEIISMKIDSHYFNADSDLIESLLNHDSSIISSSLKIDSLLDEFAGELTLLKTILPRIDKTDCHHENDIRLTKRLLYDNSSPHPPEEFVSKNSNTEIKYFSPSLIPIKDSDSFMEEIDLSFTPDDLMPPGIEDNDYDLKRDILILEELLDNYSLSLLEIELYHFNIPSFFHPPAKPPDGNTRILNIRMMGDISKQKPSAKCPMMIHGKNTPIFSSLFRDSTKSRNLHAHEMLQELKTLFAQQTEHGLLQTMRDFHSCKQEEGQSVSSYVPKMKGDIDNLERLGHLKTLSLGVSMILIGLHKELVGFVQNYNMHSLGKTINELHAMLKLYEQTLPKNNAPALHVIRAGYWKRNCPQYLAELLKKKENAASGAGGSGIFVIELNTILDRLWIYDIGCGTHICNTTQGLRASRKLKLGALSLYVGNGQREDVEAIGAFHLCLTSGLEIVLNNFHYASSITRGVSFVSRLYEEGFINRFVNNTIQVSGNSMVYFTAILRDGIFKINLSNSYTNESYIYAVSNKKANLDMDSALLWQCRLGHISKKHIKKLQHDGLLDSTDLRAFEKCVSCMSGKMARKPYTHQVERAKDLLGLIHTDICGPFKIMSGQGASYFVTFTNEFSRYGYVYLLKHKNEVFKTFKVFQKEVKNQLENSLINQEASGTLKDLEIIQEEDTHPSIDTSFNQEEDDLEVDEPQSDTVPIRRSTRTRHAPDRICLYIDVEEHELGDLDNDVWVLFELYPNGKTVGSKCLFKKKTDIDRVVHTYKARLVAKGYTQNLGIDYEKTFSPVADIRAIRILIAIAAYYDYKIWKIDVKTAILDGYLNEEVYMEQLEGFVNPKYLNQASGSNITFLILYVDDILIMGNNIPMLQSVKFYLGRCFAMKDLGASTLAELKRMQNLLYASAVGSIMNTKDMFLVYEECQAKHFATSSVEAEYIAAFDASKEAVGVRKFIFGQGVVPTIKEPISMYCDNTASIAIANESGITKGARHFHAKVHYLREVIEYGDIKLENVHADDNLVDPFTKALAFLKPSEHTRNTGMLPASSLM
uniref:Retrotransposon protein, putative, Ty1-copia subclass n=1 Tax=Tanacetum cinerariifolium TaxID=118510 RepID=A0A6L2KSB8_TANCI|nr:hypothetical protein [Tanacetum cinerariifolium]